MGFWRDVLLGTPGSSGVQSAGIKSPFSESQLQTVIWSEVFGTQPTLITRAEAMSLPAVFKARAILLSLIADKPLTARKGDDLAPTQPAWLYRTDGDVSPWLRMAGTLDDLIFYGWSLWGIERGAAGQITYAGRVPFARWKTDDRGRILVDDKPVDSADVLLIPGPSDGLLTFASRSLRGAVAIESAWVDRALNPIPQIELHQTVESGITAPEAKTLVDNWNAARNSGSSTAFTPFDVTANALGQVAPDLFTEGRNNSRLDVANFFNLPASLLDGSVSVASLTYSTQEGRRNEVFDYTLRYWLGPIEGRLSQDDVVPAGQRVRFDFSTLIDNPQTPTGAVVED